MTYIRLPFATTALLMCAAALFSGCGKSADQLATEAARAERVAVDAAAAAQAELDADHAKHLSILAAPPPSAPREYDVSTPPLSLSLDKLMNPGPNISPEFLQGMIELQVATSTHVRKRTEQEGERCFEKYRGRLLDPRAGYLVGSEVFNADGDIYLLADVSARTRGGGGTRIRFICGANIAQPPQPSEASK